MIVKRRKEERSKVWEEGTEFLVCRPCSTYSQSKEIPLDLIKTKRGKGTAHYGLISKLGRPDWDVKASLNKHCDRSLHKWCVRKADEVQKVSKTFEEK